MSLKLKTEIEKLKSEFLDGAMRQQLKDEVKEEIKEDIKKEIREERKKLKEEADKDKEILRRMKLCFVADKMVSKATQVNDDSFDNSDGDTDESVSLLAVAKKQKYI